MRIKGKRRFKCLGITLGLALLLAIMVLIPAMGIGGTQLPSLDRVNTDHAVSNAGSLLTSNCMQCHDDTNLITGKKTAWAESTHGTGEAYAVEGPRNGCAGCHSGGGFSTRVANGQDPVRPDPNNPILGDPNPTRQDCRACHQIHETYTGSDFALETTAPVNLLGDKSFDGGSGNLCASCHQARSLIPVADANGNMATTSRFGPHNGPQSPMLLGTGGSFEGTPGAMYDAAEDTCVTCHMGPNNKHTYEPEVATCKTCHPSATNFDVNGVQTQTQQKLDQLQGLLVGAGLLNCSDPVAGCKQVAKPNIPAAKAGALWNWVFITKDASRGVHNTDYTEALLDASIAALQ